MPLRNDSHTRFVPAQTRGGVLSYVSILAALMFASSAFASLQDYPFHLVTKGHGDSEQLAAENLGSSPVSLCMTLVAKSVFSKHTRTAIMIVPPRTVLPLGHADVWGRTYSYYMGRVDTIPDPTIKYRLPFANGLAFVITQAYGGPLTTHDNAQNRYAVDFAMPEGTPIVAARGGIVVDVTLSHHSHGRGASYWRKANTVTIVQDDGTIAEYAHLAPGTPLVQRGERVQTGTLIAYSGNTGYSSGPHLHFGVSRLAIVHGKVRPVSIPFLFYAGNPAVTFSPLPGLVATATYQKISRDGRRPGRGTLAWPAVGTAVSR